MERVPERCKVPKQEGGEGARGHVRIFTWMTRMSLERRDKVGCIALSESLAPIHHIMLGERGEGDEAVLSKKKYTSPGRRQWRSWGMG